MFKRSCCVKGCKKEWVCEGQCNKPKNSGNLCYCYKHFREQVGGIEKIRTFRKSEFDTEISAEKIFICCYGKEAYTVEEL